MKTKPPFDGEIHAVSAKKMPDLSNPKREPGWFLGDPTPTRDEAVPTGWKLVPIEPTEAMNMAAMVKVGISPGMAAFAYRAMLASAPAPASGGVDAVRVEPLKFVRPPNAKTMIKAETILGAARIWSHHEANGAWFWELGDFASGTEASKGDAHKMLVATYQHRILSALSPAATPVSEAGGEVEQLKAYRDELLKIAADVGEPDDPFAAWEAIAALKALAKPASSPAGGDVRRVRHKKRGGIYEVLGEAQVQTSRPLEDYEVVVIYRSLNTPDIDDPASPMKGDTWARPKAEFNDGRFEDLSQSTSAGRGE